MSFERAGVICDRIIELKKQIGKEITETEIKAATQQEAATQCEDTRRRRLCRQRLGAFGMSTQDEQCGR
jgi:hypothetical protein